MIKENETSENNEQGNSSLGGVVPVLHQIAKCIDGAIENNEDNDKISEVIELMKGIAEDNWMFARN